MKNEKSCGAVVYRTVNGELQFLVEHMVQGHTSLPKGHVEENETEAETALREIREETNLEVTLDTNFKHTITFSPREGVLKDVTFFVAKAKDGELVNQESEVASLEWLPYREAVAAMTYDDDRGTLVKAKKYLKLVDKAVKFAVKKHAGACRKGTSLPYIVHPMEAAAIAAGLTDDRRVIAAAVLHDTLEDTDTTEEELRKVFGKSVAKLVAAESEDKQEELPPGETWTERKQATLDSLKEAKHKEKLLALADKLSNIRAMERDYAAEGENLWERFNQPDPVQQAWYYRSLAEIFSADKKLADTQACREYRDRVDAVFGRYD